MERQSDLFRRLARRARLFERFEDGVAYLGGRRVRVSEGPPRICGEPCLFVREQAKGEDLLLTVTVTDAGPYALMLGYALCDQADELLRDICGFVRLSVRDARKGAGCFVCARYRGRRVPDVRAVSAVAVHSSTTRAVGSAASPAVPSRPVKAPLRSSPPSLCPVSARPSPPSTADSASEAIVVRARCPVPNSAATKKERTSAGDASLS